METTIAFLKTGKYAIHPARGPVIVCKEGDFADVSEEHAKVLGDAGWAEILEVEPAQGEGEDDDDNKNDPIVPPWEQEDWDPEVDDAKDRLEVYGLEVFDVDIDKRKSVAKIIEQLESLKELTGDN